MAAIFLSYRRDDSAGYAGRLSESLERRLGAAQVFRDVETIRAGEDFVDAIHRRLADCQAMLVVIGREWLDAVDAAGHRRLDEEHDYVRLEIATALARGDVVVVPVLVEGVTMPREEQLPPPIRALARRQAMALRDETWAADVDRLVAAIPGVHPSALRSRRTIGVIAAALAAAAIAAIVAARTYQNAREEAASAPSARNDAIAQTGPAFAIAVPRIAEMVGGHTIYSLLSGGLARHGPTTTLDLRLRFSNDGQNAIAVGDEAFRLVAGGTVVAPSGGLNELVEGHSVRQGVIRFEVPATTTQAVLKTQIEGATAELPLDLTSTGRPAATDRLDEGDALSRAILAPLVREPRPLVAGPEFSYELTRATARRFVNAARLVFSIRVSNRSAYPRFFGSTVRVVAGGETIAPNDSLNLNVAANAEASGDVIFDVPPSATTVILRTTDDGLAGDLKLDLPAVTR